MLAVRDPKLARRTLLGGKIIYGERRCILDCTVRELSDTQAVAVLPNTLRVPHIVELRIPSLAASYVCETASRTLCEIRLNILR